MLIGFGLEIWSMLFSASLPFGLYLFNNEGSWYLLVNLIYSWLCEGSIYLGERFMYLSFAFEIVGLKSKKYGGGFPMILSLSLTLYMSSEVGGSLQS